MTTPIGFGVPYTLVRQSTTPWDNDRSTADTIALMRSLAVSGSRSPTIQAIANECLQQSQGFQHEDLRGLCRCVYLWVKSHVTFAEDEAVANSRLGISYEEMNTPDGAIDMVIAPEVLVTMLNPMGDCDCFSTLLASIFIVLQIKCWFVSIKVDPNEPNRWSHVYVCVFLPDEQTMVPVDASHGNYLGWEQTDGVFERKLWDIN